MKQHITIDQLNELSEKGKERLRKWWKPRRGDMCYVKGYDKPVITLITEDGEEVWGKEGKKTREWEKSTEGQMVGYPSDMLTFPILSIGQCIEFLVEQTPKRLGQDMAGGEYFGRVVWSFMELLDNEWEVNGEKYYKSKELCDALWMAVKEVLEVDKIEKKE